MSRRITRSTAAVAIVLLAAGASPVGAATSTSTPLETTNWVLTDRVSIGTPLGGVAVNAVFDGTRVGGTSGCNGYSRSYTTSGSSMTIRNDGVSTQIACQGAAGRVEPRYLAALGKVGRFRIRGDTLTLSTRAGRRLLVYRASVGEAALRGTWNATSFSTGTVISSPIQGTTLTLIFTSGRASGNGGCNTFDGPVKLTGTDGITIGPLASTLRACGDPARDTQEQQYLAALGLAKTYQVTGDQLTLYRAGHTIAASFQRPKTGSGQ
jgi:heat shock protein HslJ